jgi:hypothetical protein
MASERYLEILVSLAPDLIFGPSFRVIAQQLTLPSGRLDLLLEDQHGTKHVAELKKDIAKPEAVHQVVRYVQDFRAYYSGNVVGWVVANGISEATLSLAAKEGIRTLEVPESSYQSILVRKGIPDSKLLGDRIQSGILVGGGSQRLSSGQINLSAVLARLPNVTGSYIRDLLACDGVSMNHGKLQTAIIYKGVKIGGVNKLHFFISTNIVTEMRDEDALLRSGFQRHQKTQINSSHTHVYWTIGPMQVGSVDLVLRHFFRKIDGILFSSGEV